MFALASTTFVALGLVLGSDMLPDRLDPFADLDPLARPGILTPLKLGRATGRPETCLAIMAALPDIRYTSLQDREVSAQCHIRGHVDLRALSTARLREGTTCATALRLYMWERHALQPAALRWFGEQVTDISDMGSFSCRRINTARGPGARMSAHATASAIDIAAVTLSDGRHLDLLFGWDAADERERAFWRDIRDGGCRWFRTVLSPDFNALHADHFHFAQGRYGTCR